MKNTKYWMALEQARGIGPAHLKMLYSTQSEMGLSIQDLFDCSTDEIKGEFHLNDRTVEGVAEAQKLVSRIENDYLALLDAGCEAVLFFEERYPERLHSKLENAFPPILFTMGNANLLEIRGAAVLGDMDVSEKGRLISYLTAKSLSEHHITVISGFAKGADMTAHRSALENAGTTIAILPYGMNHLNIPDEIKPLFDMDRILLISPFYPNTGIYPLQFLQSEQGHFRPRLCRLYR